MIHTVQTPQLRLLHRGKVRDSFYLTPTTRLIVVSDRISAFDLKIRTLIDGKGEILNRLAAFWFEKTAHIVPNHVVSLPDGQAMVVRECVPIRVEMVVRGAICGTMWRGYKSGQRNFSGVALPVGLTENALLATPVVTPTTKEESDREITPDDIVSSGLIDAKTYGQMHDVALQLFELGRQIAASKGLILADTKYEFGLYDGALMLMDEIHTPDSSRFFDAAAYAVDPLNIASFDKEFVRKWMRANRSDGALPLDLPDDVVRETRNRYAMLFERLTGAQLPVDPRPPLQRLRDNLIANGLISDGYVAIVMGSRVDLAWCESIAVEIRRYGITVDLRVISAHKNGNQIVQAANEYNSSLEPGAVIAVAGQSNGLGGALAAACNLPVINCPPFKDDADYLVNIHSSLRMPSKTPAATVCHPKLAALVAMRALNLPRLRTLFSQEIIAMRAGLAQDDEQVRQAGRAVSL